MFGSAIKKAHNAVEGIATDAAYMFFAMLLACGAFLFAAAGLAWWLSTIMPLHFALLVVAAFTAVCALVVYLIGKSNPPESKEQKEDSPLSALVNSVGSMGLPLDSITKSIAAGVLVRQFKRAPITSVAAVAALAVLAGVLLTQDDEEELN